MNTLIPLLIDTLRAKGYRIVPVSALIGKTRAQVMPPIPPSQRWQARIDAVAFWFISFFQRTVILIFFIGDVLMSARLLLIGLFALIDRLRHRRIPDVPGGFAPHVAVLIPALGVRAPIDPVEASDGALQVPDDPSRVGWWREGSAPGAATG